VFVFLFVFLLVFGARKQATHTLSQLGEIGKLGGPRAVRKQGSRSEAVWKQEGEGKQAEELI